MQRVMPEVFLPCSFWLADNYTLQNRDVEASSLFERLLSLRNDVGLLAEEYDPQAQRQASRAHRNGPEPARYRPRASKAWFVKPAWAVPAPNVTAGTADFRQLSGAFRKI
jgi:GH15 family glucan-1,4-alpha-glucosidase